MIRKMLMAIILLPAAVAAQALPEGASAPVNQYEAGDQQRPSLARAADGSYVVAWDSENQDGSVDGVYARRYDAQGQPRGDEFRVNVVTRNRQLAPRIAADAAGGFALAWLGNSQEALGIGIYARRYDASGTALGGEVRVDATGRPAYSQFDIAMAPDGRFTVAWIDHVNILGASLQQRTLNVQRYDAGGSAIGRPVEVYRSDLFNVRTPSLAMDAAGNFVVAWFIGPGSIWARRYDAGGRANGLSFRVSPSDPALQVDRPQVAAGANGDFAVAWETAAAEDLGDTGVYLRRYTADGEARGEAQRLDGRLLRNPEIAYAAGRFVVAAQSEAIYAQCVDAGSGQAGEAWRVDDSSSLHTPLFASVGADAGGALAFAWQNLVTDSGRRIEARRFGGC